MCLCIILSSYISSGIFIFSLGGTGIFHIKIAYYACEVLASSETSSFTGKPKPPFLPLQLLLAFQKFGATLEEFLHMILPHIVKLFDASDVPLSVRRTALETVDHFADYLDLSDYTSKIIHPLVCPEDSCLKSDCFFSLLLYSFDAIWISVIDAFEIGLICL